MGAALSAVGYGPDLSTYENDDHDADGSDDIPIESALAKLATSPRYKSQLEKTLMIRVMFKNHSSHTEIVSFDAISSMLMKLGIQDAGIIDYMCRHYDLDNNGEFSYAEFFHFMYTISTIHREFTVADLDKNSTISLKEIQPVLEKLNIELLDPTVKRISNIFDINNDGVLGYAEFFLLYIFLIELEKAHAICTKNLRVKAEDLCKLLDDHNKEEDAAKHLNMIFSSFEFDLTMDSFTRVVLFYKDKVKPLRKRSKARSTRHAHHVKLDLNEMGSVVEGEVADCKYLAADIEALILWRRLKDIHPRSALFVDGVSDGDVIQGYLTDCYFLGALAVLAASQPESIRKLFYAVDDKKGLFTCQFYKSGVWIKVHIDDRLPCLKPKPENTKNNNSKSQTNVPPVAEKILYYASCHDPSEFWVPIIEKAYASLHGSYDALKHGDICEALKDITGGGTQMVEITNRDIDKQWEKILAFHRNHCLMGCGIDLDPSTPESHKNAIKQNGLLGNHAYSILQCLEVDGIRFLQLRNPWGKTEWSGDWSDYSSKWDTMCSESKTRWRDKEFIRDYIRADDGKFYMCFEDFVRYFNGLYVLHQIEPKIVHGRWEDGNAEGCHHHPKWYCNPRYAIKTFEPDTTVLINLSQYDLRFRHSLNIEQGKYNRIGMYLAIKNADEDYKSMEVYEHMQTPFVDTRDTSLEFTSKSPGTYILRPCTYDPEITTYTISVHSKKHVEIEEIKTGKAHQVKGQWKQGDQILTESMRVGSKVNSEVTHGPMYHFTCSQTGNVDFLLVPELARSDDETLLTAYTVMLPKFLARKKLRMGIKMYESTVNEQYKCVFADHFDGISMCVSRTLRQDFEYIIEVIAYNPFEAVTGFELVVFSDYISSPRLYVAHSHENGVCTLTQSKNRIVLDGPA